VRSLEVGALVAALLRLDAAARLVAVAALGTVEFALFATVHFLLQVPVLLSVTALLRRRSARNPPPPAL
jgi:hypothetical protein